VEQPPTSAASEPGVRLPPDAAGMTFLSAVGALQAAYHRYVK
jgi:hypothetical protein